MASTTFVSYVVFIPFFPQFLRQMLTRSECRALPKTMLYGDNKVIHPQTVNDGEKGSSLPDLIRTRSPTRRGLLASFISPAGYGDKLYALYNTYDILFSGHYRTKFLVYYTAVHISRGSNF